MISPRTLIAARAAVTLALFAVVACDKSQAQEAAPAAEAAEGQGEGATPTADPAAGVPVIASAEATFDFGSIRPSDTVEHVFTIENQGDGDLHIERVKRT